MAKSKGSGRFIKIRCSKCKNTQVAFGRATTKVRCSECGGIVALPNGGNAKIRARVEEVLQGTKPKYF